MLAIRHPAYYSYNNDVLDTTMRKETQKNKEDMIPPTHNLTTLCNTAQPNTFRKKIVVCNTILCYLCYFCVLKFEFYRRVLRIVVID